MELWTERRTSVFLQRLISASGSGGERVIDEYCHNPAIERESLVKGLNTVMDGSNQSSAHMVLYVLPLSSRY